MTIEERQQIASEVFGECLTILKAKGKDYAGDGDSLDNFKKTAQELGLTEFQVWAVFFHKHIHSIFNGIKANPSYPQVESEPIGGRIVDVINYAVILQALLQDRDHH